MVQSQQQIMQLLNAGVQALQQKDAVEASRYFKQVLAKQPEEPNALYLLGAATKMHGQPAEAIALMQRAVATHSNPAQVYNAIGNAYQELGQSEDAIASYENALKCQDNNEEAYFNLGLLQHRQGELQEAKTALVQAIKQQPKKPAYHNALGLILQDAGQMQEAENAFKKAMALDQSYVKALHNMGALLRSQGKLEDALVYLKKAVSLASRIVEPRYIMANCYYELGYFEQADEEYRKILAIQPDYVDAHESLNKLYWEFGKTDLYAKSYTVGMKANPECAELAGKHLRALANSGKLEEGMAHGSRYAEAFPKYAVVHQQFARLQAQSGDLGGAADSYLKAVDNAPQDTSVRISASQHLIYMGEYADALEHLDAAEKISPDDQEMWALRGLCWRLQSDERYAWLCDFERFVKPSILETPKGYQSLPEFLSELKETLKLCHTAKNAPIDQTLRGGSQTHGTLFNRREPIFATLKEALRQSVAEFIRSLPKDETHPLCKYSGREFEFSASWSVWLREGGFHINHVHPAGWISSAFYVDVPDGNEEFRATKAGWIKFGESPLLLAENDTAEKFIEPKPGLLALFPSFMWHGTVAYQEAADRVTTPFDIKPL